MTIKRMQWQIQWRRVAVLFLCCLAPVQAVDFSLPDLDGRDRSLAEFRGKWLLVNFWATWCSPCIQEMPELERFHLAHKERDAQVVGINMEDMAPEQIKRFLAEHPVSYPILLAPVDGFTPLGRIPALPTTIFISPDGEVVTRQVGGLTVEMLEQLIGQGAKRRQPGLAQHGNNRSVQ